LNIERLKAYDCLRWEKRLQGQRHWSFHKEAELVDMATFFEFGVMCDVLFCV
jgi:hypothetical protein